ncbi:MAG: ATP-binding protein [Sphaerochaeta sp.]|jgi:predicted AAA+ superfamily ATPase|nr:ATP-binding protein [Sphaerochaeta sp.]
MLIDRPLYYDQIKPFIDKPVVKILTGIRRSGKSSILALIQEQLKKDAIKDEQIIAINFEVMEYFELRDFRHLYAYLRSRIDPLEGKAYLFLDEVQLVNRWEEVVNSLLSEGKSDLYITGSNSALLATEISTLLTGRYVHLQIHTLSLVEVAQFRDQAIDRELLWLYIRRGGFPMIHREAYTESGGYTLVNDIYNSILLNDVVERYAIRDVDLLKRVMSFVADSIGSPISVNRITRYFKSQQRNVDFSTIHSYLEAVSSAFLIHKVRRYDVQGRSLLGSQEKYYLADVAILHAMLGYRDQHLPGVLENIIYLELMRRGFEVYVGKVGETEIDFIATRRGEKRYIQVAYRLEAKETVLREVAPLLAIRDAWPKYVVTMESPFGDVVEGVRFVGLLSFLTDEGW